MKMYSLLESSSNTLRFLLVVTFVLNQPTIESFFYALGIHQLIVSLTVLIVLIKNNSSTGEQISFVEYINFCKSNFYKIRTDQAVGLIPIHLDVVIVGYFANYYSAGIYRIAKKLVDPINSIIVAFSPWILNKINNENKYNFKNLTINILIPTSVVIVSGYYFFGKKLIEIIAGSGFMNSYTPMLILLVGYMSYYLTFWTRHFLLLNNLILKHTKGRIVNLAVFLATSPFLISNYGYNGIALAISLSILLQKIYELSVYFKNKNIENNI